MIFRTFLEVFPESTLWSGAIVPGFYLIGGKDKVIVHEPRVRNLYRNPILLADLVEWDYSVDTPERLLALQICDHRGVARLAGDALIISDDHPYTEFPLWRVVGTSGRPPILDAHEARSGVNRAGLGIGAP